MVGDLLFARQLHHGDGLAGRALDGLQHALLAGRHEQNSLAVAACAAGAADAVYIGFSIVGNIVVNDVADARHVDTTGITSVATTISSLPFLSAQRFVRAELGSYHHLRRKWHGAGF